MYYGFGECMCCIKISGSKHSRNDYKLLAQLSGYDEAKDIYTIPTKKSVEDILKIWNAGIYTKLSDNEADKLPIETKTRALSELVKGKSTEERLKILLDSKDEINALYTGLEGIKFLSIYYAGVINFTKKLKVQRLQKFLHVNTVILLKRVYANQYMNGIQQTEA